MRPEDAPVAATLAEVADEEEDEKAEPMSTNHQLDIQIWPHERFAYYSPGWHSARYFREQLCKRCGVAVRHGVGAFEYIYVKQDGDEVQPVFSPVTGSVPVTVWSAGR